MGKGVRIPRVIRDSKGVKGKLTDWGGRIGERNWTRIWGKIPQPSIFQLSPFPQCFDGGFGVPGGGKPKAGELTWQEEAGTLGGPDPGGKIIGGWRRGGTPSLLEGGIKCRGGVTHFPKKDTMAPLAPGGQERNHTLGIL